MEKTDVYDFADGIDAELLFLQEALKENDPISEIKKRVVFIRGDIQRFMRKHDLSHDNCQKLTPEQKMQLGTDLPDDEL